MKKAYYLLFYKLYSFWKAISDDNWSDWKALLVICSLQGLLLVELYTWSDIILKDGNFEFYNPRIIILLIGITITVLNYYVLLHNDNWRKYVKEFKSYSKKKNQIINFLVLLIILLVLGSLIFAFYQMSLIDWSGYK